MKSQFPIESTNPWDKKDVTGRGGGEKEKYESLYIYGIVQAEIPTFRACSTHTWLDGVGPAPPIAAPAAVALAAAAATACAVETDAGIAA